MFYSGEKLSTASFLIALQFAPFILSSLSYFLTKGMKERNVDEENEPKNFFCTKWPFLWQLPIIQLVRQIFLWWFFWKELKHHSTQGDNVNGVLKILSKIQTFRFYQFFGQGIPTLIYLLSLTIHQDGKNGVQ